MSEAWSVRRYLLFEMGSFDNAGGWGNFSGSFAEVEAAKAEADRSDASRAHVVDLSLGRIIWVRSGSVWVDGPGWSEVTKESLERNRELHKALRRLRRRP